MQPWQAQNALMPGEHDYLRGKPMPGQVAQAPTPMQQQPAQRMMQPQQSEPAKRGGFLGGVGNALGAFLKLSNPEAYEEGLQSRARSRVGNALAGGDYEGAAQTALKAGNIDQGLAIRGAGTEQQAAQRQQEAQGVLQLFTTLEPGQVAQYAMEDPQGFERMTGMSADEFTQAGARMRQMGVTPEQFTQMVVQKAQAELGVKPAEKKPFESKTDAFGRPLAFDPNTGEFGDPFGGVKGEETNGIIYDPLTYERKADFQTPSQTGEMTDYQRQSLAIERAKAEAAANGDAGAFGLTPVYGRDANGNRVLLQTSKSGGVAQSDLPEGVTLEDDRFKSSQRALGTAEGKKAAYRTEAGQAVLAVQDKADMIMGKIDQAIEQSDFWNTGITGNLVWSSNLNATLDSIGANAMLSELINLKKQGGTLGALSEGEGRALRAAAVNLARSQGEGQLDANLKAYKLQLQRSVDLLKQAYESDYQSGQFEALPPAPPSTTNQTGATTGNNIPPAAIEALRSNPALKDQFEAKYGPGAAAMALGQ